MWMSRGDGLACEEEVDFDETDARFDDELKDEDLDGLEELEDRDLSL